MIDSTTLIGITIAYTSLIVYYYFYNISSRITNPNIPNIFYLVVILLITHGAYGAGLSAYTSYNECKRYSFSEMIYSSLTMFMWLLVPVGILFFTNLFSTPFYNIWGYNKKGDTILYSFFLSIFASLVAIVVFFNAKTVVCSANAKYIEENVKQLDKIFEEDKNTDDNK
jgi:hypothetical protein